MNALRIEKMNISETEANRIVEVLRDFSIELGFNQERIEDLDCRRRDGFIPNSYNFGGLACVAHGSQYHFEMNGTGFKNITKTLAEHYQYDLEMFLKEYNITEKQYEESESHQENFDDMRAESDDDVLLSLDMMHNGVEEETGLHTVNLRFCLSAKDAPYHRKYDDMFEYDIEFSTAEELCSKLRTILKSNKVSLFGENLESCY